MLAGVVALLLMLVLMVLPLLFLLLFLSRSVVVAIVPEQALFRLIFFASEPPLKNYITQSMARNIVTSARLQAWYESGTRRVRERYESGKRVVLEWCESGTGVV